MTIFNNSTGWHELHVEYICSRTSAGLSSPVKQFLAYIKAPASEQGLTQEPKKISNALHALYNPSSSALLIAQFGLAGVGRSPLLDQSARVDCTYSFAISRRKPVPVWGEASTLQGILAA